MDGLIEDLESAIASMDKNQFSLKDIKEIGEGIIARTTHV
jgi:hypothetical protein